MKEFKPATISIIILIILAIFFWFANKSYLSISEISNTFSGICTSLALIWIIFNNYQYQEELKNQKEEMRLTRKVMKDQKEEFIKSMKISAEQVLNTKKQNFLELYKISLDIACSYICSIKFFDDIVVNYKENNSSGEHGLKEKLIIDATKKIIANTNINFVKNLNSNNYKDLELILVIQKILIIYNNLKESTLLITLEERKGNIESLKDNDLISFLEVSSLFEIYLEANKFIELVEKESSILKF